MEEKLYTYINDNSAEDYGLMIVKIPSFYMRGIAVVAIFFASLLYVIVSLATQEVISSLVFSVICSALAYGLVYLDRRASARRSIENKKKKAAKNGRYYYDEVNYDFYSDHLMISTERSTTKVMYSEIVRVYTDDDVIYFYTKKFNLCGIIKKPDAPAGLIELIETNIPEGDAKGRVKK